MMIQLEQIVRTLALLSCMMFACGCGAVGPENDGYRTHRYDRCNVISGVDFHYHGTWMLLGQSVFDGNQGMETLIFIFRSSCRTPGARSYDGGVGVME